MPAAASTTGVSKTTVASRLSTTVVRAATTKASANRRWWLPALASRVPMAANSPAARQHSATTRIAIRNSTTGSSRPISLRAALVVRWPVARAAPVQPTAVSASTHSGGCT